MLEHGPAVLVDQLDAQALGRLLGDHLAGQEGDVGIVLHRLMDGFGGMGEVAILRRMRIGIAGGIGVGAALGLAAGQSLGGGVGGGRDCFCITDCAPPAWASSSPSTLPPMTPPDPETVWATDWGAK